MKYIKSFLIFYTANLLTLSMAWQNLQAQAKNDSLNYYRKMALHPQSAADLISTKSFFTEAYDKAIEDNEYGLVVYHLYFLGSISYKMGDYSESESLLVEALKVSKQLPNTQYKKDIKKSILNLLGINYLEQKNKTKAIEIYNKVLELAENAGDSAILYNNKSIVYKDFSDFANAENELLKAYHIIPKVKDSLTKAMILDNLGYLLSERGKDGLNLMQQAFSIRQIVGDSSQIFTSYIHFSEFSQRKGDLEQTKIYAEKALAIAEKINSPSYKHRALQILIELSGDNYAKQYKIINDSITKADKISENKFALLKYDNSEYEKQALQSQLNAEKQRSRTIISLILAIGIGIISLVSYFLLKSKHRKDKLKQILETEGRISNQVHDEVANSVFQVMTKFESDDFSKNELVLELDDLYHKARDISNQHSIIDLDSKYLETLESLLSSFETHNTNIVTKGISSIKWDAFTDIKKITVYKVLQELLINMKKHSKASLVLVVFRTKGNKLTINYSDNGQGAVLKKHTGLLNTENRINSIGGTITFETEQNQGFKVNISI